MPFGRGCNRYGRPPDEMPGSLYRVRGATPGDVGRAVRDEAGFDMGAGGPVLGLCKGWRGWPEPRCSEEPVILGL